MRLTVLMSTYNGEKFLREQLDSILAQKLPTDTELPKIRRLLFLTNMQQNTIM